MSNPKCSDDARPTAQIGLVIRPALRGDVMAIVALFVDDPTGGHGDTLDPDWVEHYCAAFDEIAASPADVLFVATLDGVVVGTFQISFSRMLVHRARLRATIESVHVASARRGDGIGSMMMRHAIEFSRARGAGIVQLTSNKRRLDAHRFYERLGFTRSHEGFKIEL